MVTEFGVLQLQCRKKDWQLGQVLTVVILYKKKGYELSQTPIKPT